MDYSLYFVCIKSTEKRHGSKCPIPPPKKTHIEGEFYLIMIRVNTYVESDKGKEIERESAIKHISKYLMQKSPIIIFYAFLNSTYLRFSCKKK